jgi:L-amino acid N-acyltransferase YncA
MPTIRPSRDDDLPAITAVYAHHVLHGTGTFETTPPGETDMAARRADVLGKGLPWLVAEEDGQVLGFAYATGSSRARPTASLPKTPFTSRRQAHGRGLGRELLTALVAQAKRAACES